MAIFCVSDDHSKVTIKTREIGARSLKFKHPSEFSIFPVDWTRSLGKKRKSAPREESRAKKGLRLRISREVLPCYLSDPVLPKDEPLSKF